VPYSATRLSSFCAVGCLSSSTEMECTSVIVHASSLWVANKKKDATTLKAFLPPTVKYVRVEVQEKYFPLVPDRITFKDSL